MLTRGQLREVVRTAPIYKSSLIRSSTYPQGNAKAGAIDIWARSIKTFTTLPEYTLVIHWETSMDRLQWGLSGDSYEVVRTETNEFGQNGYIFHRPLIGGVPLSNIHPEARTLAINQATINTRSNGHQLFPSAHP